MRTVVSSVLVVALCGVAVAAADWSSAERKFEEFKREPEHTRARVDAFCELAVTVRAIAGCVSVEMDHGMAQRLAIGRAAVILERDLQQPGMTVRRLCERRTYNKSNLDRQVPGPEWGLFLGPGHLAVISADVLEASGVFHLVRRLGEELVFLQLTDDPADALRPDYDQLLDPVRRVLAPLLAPLREAA